ncbi:hypothetical protein A3I46_02230 [Candidatus Kaiserbacteria bacterium RIFCSPLOWO2_02_FULL_54_13]|uniref:Uncharacterized protein n=1 Tax=Candidatus Kaiserbacteria bacterium RIFCSPHIGHO2_02_FULL_54_22 TaxID=1798495 RepID=A0A1F6DLY7_9BACT|nr:MAG: hypothetical protein UY89_C0031G0015 [Parcubacteria group bacterium GW2011_GWA1_54_9]OGG62403.1 MAG: hypothetical protein A3C19_00475 [Candidatus Kaiserbacteria bacterium RIFCSPHIGHO2_02_FULL_54_22]OGG68073.1 MAG: hypothetical protein A3E99_02275 [Candidatus Kaiserbacteria bacterium RIFCSPHIGHO2_12_FULL_54_16]OGG82448.1 MAG: hypothetical protein A3I46_02230 [Candidatus Kaiserbacteria bacterium RIFCSPLOWO2_02_FULL_54_13]OGG90778.1 MAG: hypothetical protein A3G12_02960 [Candidatus Kaiserb
MLIFFKILVVIAVFALVGIKVYQSLSPAQRTWLKGHLEYVGYTATILALALVLWMFWGDELTTFLQAPSLEDVWRWTKNYWLWVILILGVPLLVLFAFKALWATAVQWLLATALVMLFVVIPLVDLAWGEKPPPPPQAQVQQQQREATDCTYARPCPPALKATQVPEGSRVCFDPPVFANLEGFGYMVSSSSVAEHRYACTLEEVANGTCKEKPVGTFRFSPTNGVTPPRHWFTKDSGIVC